MKQIATIIFSCIIGLSMTLAPTIMAEHAYADDTQVAEPQQAAEELSSEEGVSTESTEEPTEAPEVTEESGVAEGSALEGLAGMNISEIENDPELCYVLEDPTFYRYYEVDENGILCKNQFNLDEVDQFIAAADANAEGINDVDNIQPCDITAMGGGVSGLGKGQTPAKYAGYNRYHCIDISWWQGNISAANWQQIRAAGVTHVIVRCGYSALKNGAHNIDSTFANNVNGAYAAGIRVGVYYYSTAVSAAEARSEAQYVISLLNNYRSKITLPVAFDYETGGRLTSSVMKSVGTASCIAFCDTIQSAGYTPMVYANYNTLTKFIDYATLQSRYKMWLANYTTNGTATTYPGNYYMWQYSSSGVVNGLSKKVDINYIFEPKTASTAASTTAATPQKAAAFTAYAAKTKTELNYRSGPGTNYKVKGTYKKGAKIKVVGTSGKWAKLSNGYYVYLKYIAKTTAAKTVKYPYTAKTTTKVNYRSGAGTNYKIKGTYKKGTKVTIKSSKNGWGLMSNGYYIYLKFTK